ncbi:phosphoglycerate mutase-like protein [Xylariaceae sp. FL1272]|nr:phosphoglycerate mutase-like protein [Xylariaceae sp. FL1272]
MLSTSLFTLISLSSITLAWEWGSSEHGSTRAINYTTVTGFFLQDDVATDPSTFDYTTVNYGLINRSYPTDHVFDPHSSKTQWQRFEHYITHLNHHTDANTQYKLLYLARHGEGYHNAAETYYGTPAWNCYWSELDGNGTTTWRDALLTPTGLTQSTKARTFWATALSTSRIPAPQSYYSSPLLRSSTTANLTFSSLPLPEDRPFRPLIKELLREGISMHTCDSRSTKSHIGSVLGGTFRFEAGFTEHDLLWKGYEAETDEAAVLRARRVMDDIFSHDESTFISMTTHSGQIRSALEVLGHRAFSLSTGQAIPVFVKAERERVRVPTTTIQSWEAQATCTAPPVSSDAVSGCVCATGSVTGAFATSAVV